MQKQIGRVEAIIKEIQSFDFVRWPPAKYGRLFGRRTIGEVLREKTANYMNPCLELTSSAVVLLAEQGFKPTFVIEEKIGEHTNKPVLHFAIEISIDGKIHTIDFSQRRNVLFYQGKYNLDKSSKREIHLGLKRIKASGFTRAQSPLSFFGVTNIKKIGRTFRHFKYPHLRAVFEAMHRADSQFLFDKVRKSKRRIRRG